MVFLDLKLVNKLVNNLIEVGITIRIVLAYIGSIYGIYEL